MEPEETNIPTFRDLADAMVADMVARVVASEERGDPFPESLIPALQADIDGTRPLNNETMFGCVVYAKGLHEAAALLRDAGKHEEADRIHGLGQLFLSFVIDDFARATQLEGQLAGKSH
jgi:hypothetical protein